jgi:modification methylase
MIKNRGKNKTTTHTYQALQGSSANMRFVKDTEIDLIVTSPPYFPEEVEQLLKKPKSEQKNFEHVESRITEYGLTLRPNFKEIKRILRPGCALILQTKDIRYGDFLIPLANLHQEIAVNSGFRLVTQFRWLSTPGSRKRLPKFIQTRKVGDFRVLDTEVFMIFSHPEGLLQGTSVDSLSKEEVFDMIQPLWRIPPSVGRNTHKYGSPQKVVRALIELFSEKGDLILDPFVGHGTTLIEAKRLGRRAIGYDTEAQCVSTTEDNLDRFKPNLRDLE